MNLERLCFQYHWTQEQFKLGLERGVYRILGIRVRGLLVAYLAFSLIEGVMEVLNLAVHPRHRRQGHAAVLMAELVRICGESGVLSGYLDVKRSNLAAIDLYTKFGFIQYGVRRNYYPDTGEDALLFRREFQQGA